MALEILTPETFKEKVFNYSESNDWKYVGSKPAIIDFYADWCGPCKAVAPILEDLAFKFKDDVTIYKVNVDESQELAGMFAISAIPSMLFIPMLGPPSMAQGAAPKKDIELAINELLNIKAEVIIEEETGD